MQSREWWLLISPVVQKSIDCLKITHHDHFIFTQHYIYMWILNWFRSKTISLSMSACNLIYFPISLQMTISFLKTWLWMPDYSPEKRIFFSIANNRWKNNNSFLLPFFIYITRIPPFHLSDTHILLGWHPFVRESCYKRGRAN